MCPTVEPGVRDLTAARGRQHQISGKRGRTQGRLNVTVVLLLRKTSGLLAHQEPSTEHLSLLKAII